MPLTPVVQFQIPRIPLLTDRVRQVIREELNKGADRGSELIRERAARLSPRGATGRLIENWRVRANISQGAGIHIERSLVNNQPYWLDVDQGTEPHWPPFHPGSPLDQWVKTVLGADTKTYFIARKISVAGTDAQNIVDRAINQMRPRVRRELLSALRRIARRLVTR